MPEPEYTPVGHALLASQSKKLFADAPKPEFAHMSSDLMLSAIYSATLATYEVSAEILKALAKD